MLQPVTTYLEKLRPCVLSLGRRLSIEPDDALQEASLCITELYPRLEALSGDRVPYLYVCIKTRLLNYRTPHESISREQSALEIPASEQDQTEPGGQSEQKYAAWYDALGQLSAKRRKSITQHSGLGMNAARPIKDMAKTARKQHIISQQISEAKKVLAKKLSAETVRTLLVSGPGVWNRGQREEQMSMIPMSQKQVVNIKYIDSTKNREAWLEALVDVDDGSGRPSYLYLDQVQILPVNEQGRYRVLILYHSVSLQSGKEKGAGRWLASLLCGEENKL